MDLFEIFRLSQEAIFANKLRSALTAFGIIIGVAAIIMLVSIGSGLQSYVSAQFAKLGSNSIFILPGKVQFGSGGGPPRSINKLTFDIVNRLERQKSQDISIILPVIEISATASYRSNSKITTLAATKTDYFSISDIKTQNGRIFSDADDRANRKVAVIGQSIAKDLYKTQNPIGQTLLISKKPFRVIGVLAPQGNVAGVDIDNQVLIPLNAGRILTGADQVNEILVRTSSTATIPQAKAQVEKILLRSLSEDDFTIMTQEQLLASVTSILSFITIALGGIAAISLIVGGVGISNIMLVSVTERTREIGLRKAVGAKPSDILGQFLVEAVILSLAGGMVGLTLGYLGSLAMSTLIQTTIPLWSVALALGFSSAVGIVFGVAPAYRASRLDPIVALRYE